MKKIPFTSLDIRNLKGQRKIAMLTAYDYSAAILANAAAIDVLLVGDSLGMVMLGNEDTLSVTMDIMAHHCQAVTKANLKALVVCDMPFLSYEASVQSALLNAGRLVGQAGARAVKLEGSFNILPQIKAIISAGIPVLGHIGLPPQRIAALGGFKVQGRSAKGAKILFEEAKVLEEAGCFALVLECVPYEVAKTITEALSIPTIGIGAGSACDGQVLVFHDMLGLNTSHIPKFVKQYANIGQNITEAISEYVNEVQNGTFPSKEQTFYLSADENVQFEQLLAQDIEG